MSEDIVVVLDALGEDDFYYRPATTKATIDKAAAEITRLRAALATARREGMEQAAKRLEELHKNHKYNPKTGEGSEHDVGYYRALAEGAAHIRAAAKEGK